MDVMIDIPVPNVINVTRNTIVTVPSATNVQRTVYRAAATRTVIHAEWATMESIVDMHVRQDAQIIIVSS